MADSGFQSMVTFSNLGPIVSPIVSPGSVFSYPPVGYRGRPYTWLAKGDLKNEKSSG
jgi:hypothetical protein